MKRRKEKITQIGQEKETQRHENTSFVKIELKTKN
jgi:hypothetical protein